MAIPLPKYKSQVRVSGQGTAQTIDPGLTIRAAGVGDELTAEIIEKAGGVASEYLQKKAKSKDEKTILQWEKDKLDAEQLIYQDIEGFMSQANTSYDEAYEMALKGAIPDLETKYKKLSFEYGTNQRAVDKDFSNFKSKININADKSKIELRKDSIVAMRSAQSSEFNRNYNILTSIYRTNVKENPDQFDKLSTAYLNDVNNLSNNINDSLVLQKIVKPSIKSASFLVNSLEESTSIKLNLAKQEEVLKGISETALTTDIYEKPNETVTISTWDAEKGKYVDQQYKTGPGQSAKIYEATQLSLSQHGFIKLQEYRQNVNKYVPVRNQIKVEGALKLNLPEAERLLNLPLDEFKLDSEQRGILKNNLNAAKELNDKNAVKIQNENFNTFKKDISFNQLLPSEAKAVASETFEQLGVTFPKYSLVGQQLIISNASGKFTVDLDGSSLNYFNQIMKILNLDESNIVQSTKFGDVQIIVPDDDTIKPISLESTASKQGIPELLTNADGEPRFGRNTNIALLTALNDRINNADYYDEGLFSKQKKFTPLEKDILKSITSSYKFLIPENAEDNIRRVGVLLIGWDQALGNEEQMQIFQKEFLDPYLQEVEENRVINRFLVD